MKEPTFAEVVRDAIAAQLVEVHTLKVGRVESYDNLQQVADVQPVMRRPFNVGAGEVDHETLPVIPNVPIIWPRAGGFAMHMPLKKGDFIVLGFTDDNIAQWRETGSESEPDDLRRHALGSAIGFAGISPMLTPLSPDPLDIAARAAGLTIGEDGTLRQIVWSASAITVGRRNPVLQRAAFVALADRTDARLEALEAQVTTLTVALTALTTTTAGIATAAGSHTHPYAGLAPPASGTTGAAPSPPAAPGAPPPAFVPVPLTTAADILKGTGPLP